MCAAADDGTLYVLLLLCVLLMMMCFWLVSVGLRWRSWASPDLCVLGVAADMHVRVLPVPGAVPGAVAVLVSVLFTFPCYSLHTMCFAVYYCASDCVLCCVLL